MQGEVGGFLVEFTEAGDLPSQPPVIKVFDFVLQVREVTAGPKKEGMEPGRDWFNGVLFAMLLHLQVMFTFTELSIG